MRRSTRTWIAIALVSTSAIVTLAVLKRDNSVEQVPQHSNAVEARHEQNEAPAVIATTASSSSFSCDGQRLDIVMNEGVEPVCMGALVTKYNGSVRSHQVATLAAPTRWLRVEFAGDAVLSAAWGREQQPDFQCQAAECKGIAISRRNAQGARVMTLDHVSMMRSHSNAAAPVLQLNGRLDIPSEQLSDLACVDQGVSIATSDSSSQMFCPGGGAGFEISDDGTKRYRFTSLDGESLLVATDHNQQIRQVTYEGEVSLACRSVECGSVRISAADAQGARRFTFAGATLIETRSGQSNAVLNGSLILPPL